MLNWTEKSWELWYGISAKGRKGTYFIHMNRSCAPHIQYLVRLDGAVIDAQDTLAQAKQRAEKEEKSKV